MSDTPTLNAGENPVADAAAAEHVKMLYSTGMQLEFAPATVATRAFLVLDGYALADVDLARVTAERDSGSGKATPEHTWKQWADEHIAENAALRASVAELEERAERYRLVTLRQDATIAELKSLLASEKSTRNAIIAKGQQAEQRNAARKQGGAHA